MSNYQGSTPETKRKADWRDSAPCHSEDPETFFPTGTGGAWKQVIAQAKSVCARCPSADPCLQFALTNGVDFGIFGGLTEDERREVARLRRAGNDTTDYVTNAREPVTLAAMFNRHTTALPDGHLGWEGHKQLGFAGVYYTPRRAAYEIATGEKPYGQVHPSCEVTECVLPEHMEDARDRHARALTDEQQVAA
ncbi:Transcriptional regulator WhiB [Streptomyces sp. enrichment culture]